MTDDTAGTTTVIDFTSRRKRAVPSCRNETFVELEAGIRADPQSAAVREQRIKEKLDRLLPPRPRADRELVRDVVLEVLTDMGIAPEA